MGRSDARSMLAAALLSGAAIREAFGSQAGIPARIAAGELRRHWRDRVQCPLGRFGRHHGRATSRAGFTLSAANLFPDAHLPISSSSRPRTRYGMTMGTGQPLCRSQGRGGAEHLADAVDRQDSQAVRVRLDNAATTLIGELRAGGRWRGSMTALRWRSPPRCAGAQRVLEMTVDYAKLREAWQTHRLSRVKHKCADMLVESRMPSH